MFGALTGILASKLLVQQSLPAMPILEVFNSIPLTSNLTYGSDQAEILYINGVFCFIGHIYNGALAPTAYSFWSTNNGETWTRDNQPSAEWNGLAYNEIVGIGVALSGNGATGDKSITTVDGINWTPRQNLQSAYWYGLGAGNGLFIGGSWQNNNIITSTNGITWTTRSTNITGGMDAVSYLNGVWLIASRHSSLLYRSTNPIASNTWQAVSGYSLATTRVYAQGDKFFIFITTNSNISSTFKMSVDGLIWTDLVIPFGDATVIHKCGNYWLSFGHSVATSNLKSFLISKDLVTWNWMPIPPEFRDFIRSGKYANGYYVGTSTDTGYAYRLSGFIA